MPNYRKRVPLEERKKIDLDLACRSLVMRVADLEDDVDLADIPASFGYPLSEKRLRQMLRGCIVEARRLRNLLDMRKDGEEAYES